MRFRAARVWRYRGLIFFVVMNLHSCESDSVGCTWPGVERRALPELSGSLFFFFLRLGVSDQPLGGCRFRLSCMYGLI
jgi:hypothetical protein